MIRSDILAYAAFRRGQDRDSGNSLALNMLRKKIKLRKIKRAHRPMDAYAAFRLGQDRARPSGNHGLFYFRRKMNRPTVLQ